MRLDISCMTKTRVATTAVRMPEEALCLFRKSGELGPFTFLIDLNELSVHTTKIDYLQVTVDFNDPDVLIIGQRGRQGNLTRKENDE